MSKRNYGIDLLRILLMLMIVIGHVFTHTNIRATLPEFSLKWNFTWLAQCVTICAVDCFILISGYCGYNHKIKLYSVCQLWGKVLLYSIITTIVLIALRIINISSNIIIDALFPVLRFRYWFFTIYIILSLLRPFLNSLIVSLSNNMKKVLLILLLLIIYILPLLSVLFYQIDEKEGMSIIGFVSLYLIGAILSNLEISISSKKCLLYLCLSSLVMFISKILLTKVVISNNLNLGTSLFYHYNTIFVLINAIALLMVFKNIKISDKAKSIITIISGSTFGVYLIHEDPNIKKLLWNDYVKDFLQRCSLFTYIFSVIGIACGIFLICITTDIIISRYIIPFIIPRKIKEHIHLICNKYDSFLYNSGRIEKETDK